MSRDYSSQALVFRASKLTEGERPQVFLELPTQVLISRSMDISDNLGVSKNRGTPKSSI